MYYKSKRFLLLYFLLLPFYIQQPTFIAFFFIFIIVYNSFLTFVAVVTRLLLHILLFSNCIMYLNGGPLEKQRELKSQPFLKIFNNNNNNNND